MKVVVSDPTVIQYLDELKNFVDVPIQWLPCEERGERLLTLLAEADVFVGSPFTAEMAERAPVLRLIQIPGAGTGGVDFDNLPRGVTVANTYNHERSIAEYVLMSMLALSRRLMTADAELRQGRWFAARHDPQIPLPSTLEQQTVGIVGFGHIGQQVARLAAGLGMRVLAIKREPVPDLADRFGLFFLGGQQNLDFLLAESDFLILAAPSTPETSGMIDDKALAKMKPTSFLINVARGALVDEQALFNALSSGQIGGAAIDTWYKYPGADGLSQPATLPFNTLKNVLMTPHTSGETLQTKNGRIRDIGENIQRLAKGKPLQNVVVSLS